MEDEFYEEIDAKTVLPEINADIFFNGISKSQKELINDYLILDLFLYFVFDQREKGLNLILNLDDMFKEIKKDQALIRQRPAL